MIVDLNGIGYRYDIQSICLLFFPRERFSEEAGKRLCLKLSFGKITAEFFFREKVFKCEEILDDRLFDSLRTSVKRAAYNVLSTATGIKSPWGIVTGIRPAVLLEKVTDTCGEKSKGIFTDIYGVSEEKTELCLNVLRNRRAAVSLNKENNCSLYISIPFCPSRCRYCSFVSASTEKEKEQIPEYVKYLCFELEQKAAEIRNSRMNVLTVYIGGGTPTVLAASELETLLSAVKNLFISCYDIREFTVEAGRPDTISEEKLGIMAKYGVTRISVNPQTLDNRVLSIAGRKHTVEDFFRAYELAAKYSFIKNVDLIAGLPGDSPEGFCDTLNKVISLDPENITIHTLYLKRAADFGAHENVGAVKAESGKTDVSAMLEYAQKVMALNGYGAYYLYRQKNTLENLENVGYSKNGLECLYNIYMMDDIQQIYGAGAGAVTKLKTDTGVTRINNTKFGYNYIKEMKDILGGDRTCTAYLTERRNE